MESIVTSAKEDIFRMKSYSSAVLVIPLLSKIKERNSFFMYFFNKNHKRGI